MNINNLTNAKVGDVYKLLSIMATNADQHLGIFKVVSINGDKVTTVELESEYTKAKPELCLVGTYTYFIKGYCRFIKISELKPNTIKTGEDYIKWLGGDRK